ncbi:MAG: mechanosensitive ion channel [Proteobacteria bacterium]|nr:mechanosensitive ion channel [Pseudomonadota bacterium]MBU0967753.1 mechanosensitive ion channel [Pseudomonadota bacterium]
MLVEKYRVKLTLFHWLDNLHCYILLILVLVTVTTHLSINTTSCQIVIGTAALLAGLTIKDFLSGIAAGIMPSCRTFSQPCLFHWAEPGKIR